MRDIRFLLKTHYTNSRALVIGIDSYKQTSPLSYAVSDASEVKNILVSDLNFQEKDIAYLIDSDATRDNIMKAFLRFAKDDIDLDERILVFYAGHGHTKTGNRVEIGYLVPFDADMSDLSSLIRWDELTRNTELIRAKHVLFVMDACYGGLALTRNVQSGSTRFLKDMMKRPSCQVLTAGKADQLVSDSGGPIPNHSVFTGHFIEGIRGKASTDDEIITASGLMAYVYGKVANDKNSNQTPHYGYLDGDGDFIIKAPTLSNLEKSEKKDIDNLISIPFFDVPSQLETTEEKITHVKKLLASETGSIELHDFLTKEVREFLLFTSDDSFDAHGQFSQKELINRLSNYEKGSKDLSILLACVAHWAKPTHKSILQKCIARSSDRLELQGGSRAWLALRWYPLLIELYCSGIAAVDAQRFDSLATIFYTMIPTLDNASREETFVEGITNGVLVLKQMEIVKQIPGHENNYTPLSEYLFKILQPQLDDVLFIGKNYEGVFDRFEVYLALVVVDLRLIRKEHPWGPIGRFGWKHGHYDNGPLVKVVEEGRSEGEDWLPLKAGLFGGSFDRFTQAATTHIESVSKLNWF